MLGWLGIYKEEMAKPEEVKKAAETADFKEFMASPDTKNFIKDWSTKIDRKTGEPMYTKAGVIELLRVLYESRSFASDKKVLKAANEILSLLRGADTLKGFLAGWKAKSEGIIKGIQSLGGSLFKKAA